MSKQYQTTFRYGEEIEEKIREELESAPYKPSKAQVIRRALERGLDC